MCTESAQLLLLTLAHSKSRGCRLVYEGVPVTDIGIVTTRIPFDSINNPYLCPTDREDFQVCDNNDTQLLSKRSCAVPDSISHCILKIETSKGRWWFDITATQFDIFEYSFSGYPLSIVPEEKWPKYFKVITGQIDGIFVASHYDILMYSVDLYAFQSALVNILPDGRTIDNIALQTIKSPKLRTYHMFVNGIYPAISSEEMSKRGIICDRLRSSVSNNISKLSSELQDYLIIGKNGYFWRVYIVDLSLYDKMDNKSLIAELSLAIKYSMFYNSTVESMTKEVFSNGGYPTYSKLFHLISQQMIPVKGIFENPTNGSILFVSPDEQPYPLRYIYGEKSNNNNNNNNNKACEYFQFGVTLTSVKI